MRRGPVAVELRDGFATPADDRLIVGLSRLIEESPELLVGERLDLVDVQQDGLALGRPDLLNEPLEELRRLGRLGQDPGRAAQVDGPHPPQLSPCRDAMARRRCGQADQEGEPAHRHTIARHPAREPAFREHVEK